MNLKSEGLSVSQFQAFNESVYGPNNRTHYDQWGLVMKLNRFISLIHKDVRKGKRHNLKRDLAQAYSWANALANRRNLRLDHELWRHYPGLCPYCASRPCKKELHDNKGRRYLSHISKSPYWPKTIGDYQVMFAGIYPQNTLEDSSGHLSEEGGEIIEALWMHRSTNEGYWLASISLELIDVVAHIFAVCTCAHIDLAQLLYFEYKEGCIGCHKPECQCGIVSTAKSVFVN